MQVCSSLQTDNHASTSLLSFLQAGCPSGCPTNSIKALKALSKVVKYTNTATWHCDSTTGTRRPYGITQCYLPPGRGDILAFTVAEAGTQFSDPKGMQGWVDLCTTVKLCSPCPRLCIAVAVVINTTGRGEIPITPQLGTMTTVTWDDSLPHIPCMTVWNIQNLSLDHQDNICN